MRRWKVQSKPDINPQEWDFRGISSEQLEGAIRYEYARETPWIRKLFSKWHAEKFVPAPGSGLGRAGDTVGQILEETFCGTEPNPNYLVHLVNFGEAAMEPLSSLLIELTILFPKPFLSLDDFEREEIASIRRREPSVKRLIGFKPLPTKLTRRYAEAGLHFVSLRLNLRRSKTSILKELDELIDKLREQFPQKRPAEGKAAHLPWDKLSALAAYRLKNAYGIERALEKVDKYLGSEPQHKALPAQTSVSFGQDSDSQPRPWALPPQNSVSFGQAAGRAEKVIADLWGSFAGESFFPEFRPEDFAPGFDSPPPDPNYYEDIPAVLTHKTALAKQKSNKSKTA